MKFWSNPVWKCSVFIDGYNKAMKISSKGYPDMGVSEAESEKVLRGSREGFSDSVKQILRLYAKGSVIPE